MPAARGLQRPDSRPFPQRPTAPAPWILALFLAACAGCGESGYVLLARDGGQALSRIDGAIDDRPDAGAATVTCDTVDLLLAIDGSGSMDDERDAIIEELFPALASELSHVGTGVQDYRVAVVDGCPDPAVFHTAGAGGDCAFQGGNAWMMGSSPDLVDEFTCVADIEPPPGSRCDDGRDEDEQPISTAATALLPPYTGAPSPNAGFLRPSALLVVIAATDEDEDPKDVNPETPAELYERLVRIKGDPRRMLMIGIGGGEDCSGPYGSADEARALRDMVDRFSVIERGQFWDLCPGDLGLHAASLLTAIHAACEAYPAPF